MNILIGLIPALFWGILPLCVSKIGGKPTQQNYGYHDGRAPRGYATSLLFFPIRLDAWAFFLCFLSGASWAFGQMNQYRAFTQNRCFSNHAFIDWYAAGRYFADGRGGVR